jgi:hypothetical protein
LAKTFFLNETLSLNKKKFLVKFLPFCKTFLFHNKNLYLFLPFNKFFFSQLNIYSWQKQTMNAHILSNLQAQQTYNENNAIDQMKKKSQS